MTDIRVKDLTEASVPGADYYLLTDSATDGVKKVKTTNIVTAATIGAATLAGTETLTNKTISGVSNTLSNIPNAALTNSGVTVSGHALPLGGTLNLVPADLGAIADGTVLSNTSGGSAAPVANTITALLDKLLGTTQGSVVYRSATSWAALAPGILGQYLQTFGASANPAWNTPAGGGDMLQASNLNDVLDKTQARKNLAVYGGSVDLRLYGYVADGTTDNTTALNNAIAYANSVGNVTLLVPEGVGLAGNTNAITANNVWFKAMGAPGATTIKGTSSAGLFTFGSASIFGQGCGIEGVRFQGNSNTSQVLINAYNGQEMLLTNCILADGVATFVKMGSATTTFGSITVLNLTGKVPNIAAPVFSLVSGSGLFMVGGYIYNQAVAGQSVAGRDFFQCFGNWNTLSVRSTFLYLFDTTLLVDILSGKQFGDVHMVGNYFDEMGRTFALAAESGGVIANVKIEHNEFTGKNGAGFLLFGAGAFLNLELNHNVIRECKSNCIQISSPLTLGKFIGNTVSQANEPCSFTGSISGTTLTVTATSGAPGGIIKIGDVITGAGITGGTSVTALGTGTGKIGTYTVNNSQTVASEAMTANTGGSHMTMVTGSTDITIALNSFGNSSDLLGPGGGQYGLSIAGGDKFAILGNKAKGSIADWNIGTLTNSTIAANPGFADASSSDAWTAYTPTLTSTGGGAFTSASASGLYKKIGKTVHYTVTVTVTTVGSATGFVQFTLPPFTAAAAGTYISAGIFAGNSVNAVVTAGGATAYFATYNGGATATTTGTATVSGSYQAA